MKKTKTAKKKRHAWKYPVGYGLVTKERPAICQREGCGWLLWQEKSKRKSTRWNSSGEVTLVSAPGGTPIPYSLVPACGGA